jgi:hypothetical protein
MNRLINFFSGKGRLLKPRNFFILGMLILGGCGNAFGQISESSTNTVARLCIALAQSGENETVAWRAGKPMWRKPAYPGYAMGEYTFPAGPLGLELRHPARPPLAVNQKLLAGKCYLLVVDQKPNPDEKTKAQFPAVTDARWVELPWGEPSAEPAAFAYVAAAQPVPLRMNDKAVSLSPGRVEKLAAGYMLFTDAAGNPVMDLNPSGGAFLLLVFFADSMSKLAPVRCYYY